MALPDRRRPEPPEFAAFLSGKRVVLVGPAATLSGAGLGAEIDGYDVVVRINLGCPVPAELHEDLGTRTDLLYHVLHPVSHERDLGMRHTIEQVEGWKAAGVQWLVTRQTRTAERFVRAREALERIPVIHIGTAFQAGIRRATGSSPNTGVIAIAHLLAQPIASLHVVGFDFYASGYYPGYGGLTAEEAARGGGSGRAYPAWGQLGHTREIHHQEGQMRYLRQLAHADPRLTFDGPATARLGIVGAGPSITALVPIKGHSQRVPGKNLRRLAGKPLLAWALKHLTASHRVAQVVVDTDSDEIERAVREHAPTVTVIRRPEHLQDGDAVTGNDLIAWDLTQVEGEHFGQFHVTSPLLRPDTIDRAVAAYFEEDEHDSLFAVTEHHIWLFRADGTPVNSDPGHLVRSQDLEPLYEDNNALHLFSRTSFSTTGSRIGERPRMFPISRIESLDIDWEDDFLIADAVARAGHV